MRHLISKSLVVTAVSTVVGATLLLAPATAQAATPTDDPAPGTPTSVLVLTVAYDRNTGEAHSLICDPTGGDHPKAQAACDEITAANGDFDNLPGDPDNYACPMIDLPVTASVAGSWQGSEVEWRHTYTNDCWMHKDTGSVFDF